MMGWLLSKTEETRTFSHFENISSQKKKRWSGWAEFSKNKQKKKRLIGIYLWGPCWLGGRPKV
jgi:hypothetical protein